jgi:hypothetical protein
MPVGVRGLKNRRPVAIGPVIIQVTAWRIVSPIGLVLSGRQIGWLDLIHQMGHEVLHGLIEARFSLTSKKNEASNRDGR